MLLSSASPTALEEWKEIASVRYARPITSLGVKRGAQTAFYVGNENVQRVNRDMSLSTVIPESGERVRCLQVDKDGRIAAGRGRIIEIYRGDHLELFLEHEGDVNCFSWEGDWLVSCSDNLVYVWNSSTGLLQRRLTFDSLIQSVSVSPMQDLMFAHSGNEFFVCSMDREDVDLRGRVPTSATMSCSSLGQTCAFVGCTDGTCFAINMGNQSQIKSLFGHSKNVRSVHLSKDERRAVSASWDCSLRVWCLESGQPLRILDNVHTSYVTVGRFFGSDESFIVSGSSDSTLRIFDLYQGDRERLLAFVGRPHKDTKPHKLPFEVLRQIKAMLFGNCE